MPSVYRELPAESRTEFAAAGYRAKYFFPHRFYYLPKCGPDAFKLGSRMLGRKGLRDHWQIVLFTDHSTLDRFPAELFFDKQLNWHQQHLYRPGQIAWANIFVEDNRVLTIAHQSDYVQRIANRREFKSAVESTFRGWHRLLLNCIANFALDQGLSEVCIPASSFAMKHTDPKRVVKPDLFERVYDRAVNHQFVTTRVRDWWRVDIAANRGAIVIGRRRSETIERRKTICICHDVERGLGHRHTDPQFALRAEQDAPWALDAMLDIERRLNVRATYNVAGVFLDDVRERIERDGHCLAFHSFNHEIDEKQLPRCRQVDYRLKGYRAPQSVMTPELGDHELCWHNFEWLARSAYSSGFYKPRLENRIAKIPILFDDFDMYRGRITFDGWRRMAIDAMEKNDFVAFSMHDCYAHLWLSNYEQFLREVKTLGSLKTLDEISADLFLAGAV
jgi:hypothetical protein